MTPDEYRAKWGLPKDYPMVAPAYAKLRSSMAKSFGLGRKAAVVEAEPEVELEPEAPKKRSRAKAVTALPLRMGSPNVCASIFGRPASCNYPDVRRFSLLAYADPSEVSQ